MINKTYQIDYSDWFDEGGYCQVYPIKNNPKLVFKEFYNKKRAIKALSNQKKLAKFDLAPEVYTSVCKLKFAKDENVLYHPVSDWGYVTEFAKTFKANTGISMMQIQRLVDDILNKTGLKFWDCHWYNIGMVKRNNKKHIVCIDTGSESFEGRSNAWGYSTPGPKCCYCYKYECKCG